MLQKSKLSFILTLALSAALALDPKALERRMARMLKTPVIRTGK